jgi:recombination protein RecA
MQKDEVLKAIEKLNDSVGGSDLYVRQYVPTRIPAVDYRILKRGGVPDGKIIEIFGPTGAGKSILAVMLLAEKQRMDPDRIAFIIDTEFSFDPDFAEMFGLDMRRVIIKRTNIAEDAINYAIEAIESGGVCGCLIDSIGNFEAKTRMVGARFEYDKKANNYKSDQPGVIAKLTGAGARRMAHGAFTHNCLVIGVNHLHPKIAQTFSPTPGEERSGGKKWEYNRHVALKLTRVGDLKQGDEIIGLESKITVQRSKISAGGATGDGEHAKFWFLGETVGRVYNAWDAAILLGIIERKGAFYEWHAQQMRWRGNKAGLQELQDSLSLLELLEEQVRNFNASASAGEDDVSEPEE